MTLASLARPFSRSDVRMIERAVKGGWDTPPETQRRIAEDLRAQLETESSPRLRTAIEECLATMASTPTA